jgi:hypothetical protein
MPESLRDNCYISSGENAGTHRVCPEALKVATLPLDYHSLLASNQLMGILIAFKVLQNGKIQFCNTRNRSQ